MASNSRFNNHVNQTVEAVDMLLDAYYRLLALDQDRVAVGYSSPLPSELSFEGTNDHLNEADYLAVFTSLAALQTLMSQGHLTNLSKAVRSP